MHLPTEESTMGVAFLRGTLFGAAGVSKENKSPDGAEMLSDEAISSEPGAGVLSW